MVMLFIGCGADLLNNKKKSQMNMINFTDSECFCLEDAMKEYKKTHSKYCDEDGTAEIDNILLKLENDRNQKHAMFKAMHNLTHTTN